MIENTPLMFILYIKFIVNLETLKYYLFTSHDEIFKTRISFHRKKQIHPILIKSFINEHINI